MTAPLATLALALTQALALAPTLAAQTPEAGRALSEDLLPFELDAAQVERLRAGKILARLSETEASAVKEVVAVATVAAPAERVFRAVTDNAAFAEFLPNVRESRIEGREGDALINFQSLDLPFVRDRHYRIRVSNRIEGPPERALYRSSWSYIPDSGNIVDNRGSWVVHHLAPQEALVVYKAFVDPGGSIPKWFVERASRRGIPDLIRAVRERVSHPKYDLDEAAGPEADEPVRPDEQVHPDEPR